jgi:serine/threonine-protein kinase
MKSGRPDFDGTSSFLSKEEPLLAFDRQQTRRGAGPVDVSVHASGQLILAPGARVAEHYEVGPIIGAGATGLVYKARHVELGQLVALKVIRPDIARDSSLWRRFARESRALAALHNKHVVRVHDAGTLASGLRYLIMELLVGRSLRALQNEGRVLGQGQVVDYATQVCSALADAHRANIVHRDIRPENIFLAQYRALEPTIKLLDFGMALILDDAGQLTITGRTGALPEYLSPEQLRDPRAADARSDLWAVGVLMYELLAGRTPLHGLNAAQIYARIAQGSLPLIQTSRPELPAGLSAVVHACLELEPARRPQSADELCLALEPFSSRHTAA